LTSADKRLKLVSRRRLRKMQHSTMTRYCNITDTQEKEREDNEGDIEKKGRRDLRGHIPHTKHNKDKTLVTREETLQNKD